MSGRPNQHSELVFDVLRYAARLLADGDESTLLEMGFTSEQIRSIEELTLKSLQRVGQLSAHFMDFRVDPVCFSRVMRRIEQERADEALKDDLLRAGAPIRMMHHFWGMTSRDCAERRRVLDVEAPIGRPGRADDDSLERLWHLWQELGSITDERQRYLELARQSELSLSVIWLAVEEWKGADTIESDARPSMSSERSQEGTRAAGRVVEMHR